MGAASAFLLSDDLDTAYVGHADGRVTALDAATLSIRWVTQVADDAVHGLTVAPGGLLVCGSRGGTVRTVDAARGSRLRDLAVVPTRLHAVATSVDGTVVAGGRNGLLYLLPDNEDRPVEPVRGHRNQIRAIAATGRRHEVVTGSYDGTLLVWDLLARKARLLGRHPDWVIALAAARDGGLCAAGSADGTIRLWGTDRTQGDAEPTERGVRAIAVSADGGRVAAVGPGRTVRLFDPRAGRTLIRRRLPGRDLVQVAIAPSSGHVVATSYNGSVWRLSPDGADPVRLRGHRWGADALALTPDGRRAVTASRDATLRIWELEHGVCSGVVADEVPFSRVAVSGDGALIATADWLDRVSLYALRSGRLLARLGEHRKTISALTFTPRGRRVISGSWDGSVRLWDREGPRWSVEHDEWVTQVAVLPGGRTAVAGHADGALRLLDLHRGRIRADLVGHTGFIVALAVTNHGDLVASAAGDRTIRVWSVLRQRELCAFAVADGVECLGFAVDDRTLVAGDRVGRLAAYRVEAAR